MDAFFRSWKLVQAKNFDKYLRALGVEEEKIRIAQIIKPTLTIYQDGEFIVVKRESSIYSGEIWFRLGEEFTEETKDGRLCANVVTLDGNKLVRVEKWDGNQSTTVHEINGENLVLTQTFGNVVAVHTFQKV